MEFSVSYATINDGFMYHDKISKHHVGSVVHDFYSKNHAASGTAEEWLQRIQNNQVLLSATGKPVAPDTVLKAGERLTYFRLPWAEPEAPSSISVLYEDEHVLAVAKPAGLQVLPKASFCQRTVLGLLQAYQQQVRCKRYAGSQQPVPVHRLGRGTSGVLLCSCTVAARQKLCRDFRASTEMGVRSSTHSSGTGESEGRRQQGAAGGCSSGGDSRDDCTAALERPLGKTYRALVSGIVEQDEVGVTSSTAATRLFTSSKLQFLCCAQLSWPCRVCYFASLIATRLLQAMLAGALCCCCFCRVRWMWP
eukprot:GHRQ01019698.1.p1 GENE.GHRQ01019698.1~~GHRQ01019698.1.p1  ORF type:complete len:307 (+),score=69.96 GHRQ01019698.1:351-1271(+)